MAKTAVSPSAVTAVPGFQGVIVDANVPKGKVAAKAPAPSAVSATGSQTMPQTASGAGQTGSQTILQPPSGNGQTV